MSVVSYFTKILANGRYLQYKPTEPFTVNGSTFKGVIILSTAPTTFIVTQRNDPDLFHNIQVSDTQYIVVLPNSNNLPAEVKNIVGTNTNFMTTTNTLSSWFIMDPNAPQPFSSITASTANLLDVTAGLNIVNSAGQSWGVANNRLFLGTSAAAFGFAQITDSNIVVGSTSTSGGGGGIVLEEDTQSNSEYVVFADNLTGPTSTLLTNIGLRYRPDVNRLTVSAVRTNKIGSGLNPDGVDNLSIGNQALAAFGGSFTAGSSNIAIGTNAMNTASIAEVINNVAIGTGSLQNVNGIANSQDNGVNNTAIGYNSLFNSSTGGNNIAVGYLAGNNYTTNESNNILIGSPGVADDNNIIRIGTDTKLAAFMPPVLLRKTIPYGFAGPTPEDITASELLFNGILVYNGGGIVNINLPTAVAITSYFGNSVQDGDTFSFVFCNTASDPVTLLPGFGIVIIGSAIIAGNTTRTFYMRYEFGDSPLWNLY